VLGSAVLALCFAVGVLAWPDGVVAGSPTGVGDGEVGSVAGVGDGAVVASAGAFGAGALGIVAAGAFGVVAAGAFGVVAAGASGAGAAGAAVVTGCEVCGASAGPV
jgi:hypothetical protein